MAKYFIDFEFIEGFNKPLFGKNRHFIDMISVGIVCEDGRNYYAISNEYNYKDANKWVQENVIIPMYSKTVSGDLRNRLSATNFHKYFGKSNKQISLEMIQFIIDTAPEGDLIKNSTPEFYGYYSDYDWVLFCSLFGRMIDLPENFPMYCKDLKQTLDCAATGIDGFTFEQALAAIKNDPEYPKQSDEHHALSDAKWNKELYDFLNRKTKY